MPIHRVLVKIKWKNIHKVLCAVLGLHKCSINVSCYRQVAAGVLECGWRSELCWETEVVSDLEHQAMELKEVV